MTAPDAPGWDEHEAELERKGRLRRRQEAAWEAADGREDERHEPVRD